MLRRIATVHRDPRVEMKSRFALIPALISLSIAAVVAWGIAHFSRLGFWPAYGIVVAAMLINGIVAEAEDDAPGGFNNPLPPDGEPAGAEAENHEALHPSQPSDNAKPAKPPAP